MRETVIRARGITYRYPRGDRPALDGAKLEIGRGECVLLCGGNALLWDFGRERPP